MNRSTRVILATLGGVALAVVGFLVGHKRADLEATAIPLALAAQTSEMNELKARAQAAEADVDTLLEAVRADKDAQNPVRTPTLADLHAGLKKAEDLVRSGRNGEALALYRELYNMGRIGNTTLSRNLVLQKLSKIAVTDPAARQVLVDLRDSGMHELQSGSTDRRVTGDVVLINRELRDNASTIALYNSLPPGDTRRQAVATIGIDAFIESRLYDAIIEARPFGHMLTELDAGMARAGNANSNMAGTSSAQRSQTSRHS
jgi:hypothetical protein